MLQKAGQQRKKAPFCTLPCFIRGALGYNNRHYHNLFAASAMRRENRVVSPEFLKALAYSEGVISVLVPFFGTRRARAVTLANGSPHC